MAGQMAYAWKANTRHSVPAQVAGEEISRIRATKGEFFAPGDVVESAREQGSPLHPEFEWDDEAAAEQYRLEQARHIIKSIVVVETIEPEREPIRAFVSVRTDDGPRFTTTAYAFSVPDLRENVLSQALADFRAFERKYSAFIDLTKVATAFESARVKAERALEAGAR